MTADIDTKNFDNFTKEVEEQALEMPFDYSFADNHRAVKLLVNFSIVFISN